MEEFLYSIEREKWMVKKVVHDFTFFLKLFKPITKLIVKHQLLDVTSLEDDPKMSCECFVVMEEYND